MGRLSLRVFVCDLAVLAAAATVVAWTVMASL